MTDNDKEIPAEQAPLKLPESVIKAMDAILDDDLDATMEERFDALMQGLVAFRYYLIRRHAKEGKKKFDEEEVFLFEATAQLKEVERVFSMARKNGRISNNPNSDFDDQLRSKVVKMTGTMGDIVTKVPSHKKSS